MRKKRITLVFLGAIGLGISSVVLLWAQCHPVLRWTAVVLFATAGLILIIIALFAGDRYVENTLKNV